MTHNALGRKEFFCLIQNVTAGGSNGRGEGRMEIEIRKSARELTLTQDGREAYRCRVGLGPNAKGPKQKSGDGRTPEGTYRICLVKEPGKYGRSLGLSYPGEHDARAGFLRGDIDRATLEAILLAHAQKRRPPWGTALGGEIYLHEGGSATDWTQGCVALDAADMDVIFPCWPQIERVVLRP